MRRPLRALLAPLPGFLTLLLVLGYSALKWTLDRLLIPLGIVYLLYLSYRSSNALLAGLMLLAGIQWVRSERERKLIEKGGGF